MGRSCSEALNALVSRIVCAVGRREAGCVLLAAALLPFAVLLEAAGLELLAGDLLPGGFAVALLVLVGFFAWSVVSGAGVCVRPATPPEANGLIAARIEATATAPRSLPRMLVTVSAFSQPTYPL